MTCNDTEETYISEGVLNFNDDHCTHCVNAYSPIFFKETGDYLSKFQANKSQV